MQLNQWKNTASVLKWFRNIKSKQTHSFISFDVVEFYPSITPDLLNEALNFAANHVNITTDEREIIIQAKESCLYSDNQPWGKKDSASLFDVTMGSYDGAETCELVGLFLLSQITAKYGPDFGLYRDDGLGVINASPRRVELIKKGLCTLFNQYGLKITIEANKKIVNFLDVTLDLQNGTHTPYSKPNNTTLYVHKKSNYPPAIIKQIPDAINKRLSSLSHDETAFSTAKPVYQEALKKSGYDHDLQFTPTPIRPAQKPKRKRNITWYNPPFSKNVSTNVGRTFLKILDNAFPKDHALHKIFNRNTVKISYGCMTNLQQIISAHNKSKLVDSTRSDEPSGCNCRDPSSCPLPGNCNAESVIYQATVTTDDSNPPQTYIGHTEGTFKLRYNNHKSSFNCKSKKYSTRLSEHIWHLKENKVNYSVSWKIIKKAKSFNPASNRCNLCNWEKFFHYV